MPAVRVGVLGPLSLRVDEVEVDLASAKQAAVLAVLALDAGRAVPIERIIEAVWGVDARDGAEHSLQQHVSTLRKTLEPSRGPRQDPTVLLTRRSGYELAADVDLAEFDQLATRSSALAAAGRLQEMLDLADEALALWRGEPFADVRVSSWFDAAAAGVEERRLVVIERRNEALLALGGHAALVPELESQVVDHPFREGLWAQLMLALYRSGRQADAVAAFGRARTLLGEELGLVPGPALRDLETRILQQDPDLLVGGAGPATGDHDLRATYRSGVGTAGRIRMPDGQVVHLVHGENLIGRVPGSVVQLTDSRVSREHASVVVRDDGATLRDLGSTNGTFVDGEPVAELRLDGPLTFSVGGVDLGYEP
jgi:DNA-binding SARP family transcriptional activator